MTPSSPPDWPSRCAAAWLLAVVATWPWVGVSEGLLSSGALFVLWATLWRRYRRELPLASREAWALATALFLAYWLPELLSALDVPWAGRSWREVLLDLRYLPFLLAVAMAVATSAGRRWVARGLALIVAVWTLDGLLQAATGWSLGGPATADRLSGVFGAGNLKLGLVLASLAPFALDAAVVRAGRVGWLLAAIALGIVIGLAGARASWLTYALVLLVSGRALFGGKRLLAGVALGALLAAGLGTWLSPRFEARLTRSAAVAQGGEENLDVALSGRISIWKAATRMALDHPVNGVGVREFRDVYAHYADRDDFFLRQGEGGALHAHQLVLELLSETGILGLLCWAFGAWTAWRAWRWVRPPARTRARTAALALVVTVFPLNTHLAFYSNFWGGVFLLLVGLYAGLLMARPDDEPAAA